LWIASGATTARMAQAIRTSACSLGSARSRPDSQARQKNLRRSDDLTEKQ
jgi:hypothetical protein